MSVCAALGSSLSLHGLFLEGYIGNSWTRFQSRTCISCTAQTFSQICRGTFRTHPTSAEGGAAITLHPSLGWLSPFSTEDQVEIEFPGSPRRRGSLAPRSGCRRLYAGCVQSFPRPTTLPHLAAAGEVGVCVHMSVCLCELCVESREREEVLVLRSYELHPELGPRTCDLEVSMSHTYSTLWRDWRTNEKMLGLGLGEEIPEKSSEIS